MGRGDHVLFRSRELSGSRRRHRRADRRALLPHAPTSRKDGTVDEATRVGTRRSLRSAPVTPPRLPTASATSVDPPREAAFRPAFGGSSASAAAGRADRRGDWKRKARKFVLLAKYTCTAASSVAWSIEARTSMRDTLRHPPLPRMPILDGARVRPDAGERRAASGRSPRSRIAANGPPGTIPGDAPERRACRPIARGVFGYRSSLAEAGSSCR